MHLVSLAVVLHLAHPQRLVFLMTNGLTMREFLRMTFDIRHRHRRFGPRTHSGSPVWRTHVTCCTAVNKNELSAGANPGQQIPQTSNACQWCNSSIRRLQLCLLSTKRHSVTIGDQSRHRQDRASNVHNFKRHFCWSYDWRNLHLNVTSSIRFQSLSTCRAQRDCAHLENGLFAQISLWCLLSSNIIIQWSS